ncbi:MAG: hypothetical protein J0H99_19820, partial [Rhodospirillales bacterium]|nr:hypothetical protein [Rhodospirillales bacterium]
NPAKVKAKDLPAFLKGGVGGLTEPEDVLDMGNSGTAARLLCRGHAFPDRSPIALGRPLQRSGAGLDALPIDFFECPAAGQIDRDPGARGRSHKQVRVPNIQAHVGHARDKADFPRACDVSATRQNQRVPFFSQCEIPAERKFRKLA